MLRTAKEEIWKVLRYRLRFLSARLVLQRRSHPAEGGLLGDQWMRCVFDILFLALGNVVFSEWSKSSRGLGSASERFAREVGCGGVGFRGVFAFSAFFAFLLAIFDFGEA